MSTLSNVSEMDQAKGKEDSKKGFGSRLKRFFGGVGGGGGGGGGGKKKDKAKELSRSEHLSQAEDASYSAFGRLQSDSSAYTTEFQAAKAREYEVYLKMIQPEDNIREKESTGVIYHGGKPYGCDERDKIGHNVGVTGLDGQWVMEEPEVEFDDRLAYEMYGQHDVYQRVQKLQHQMCTVKHRNVNISCQTRLLEHQNKTSLQQIEELGRQNRRLIADNTAYIAQALENQVLEQDLNNCEILVQKIESTLSDEDRRSYEMMRDSQRCRDQRRQLLDDLQRFELTTVASGIKVDLLQQRESLIDACKVDHHVRKIMADQIQAMEGSIRVYVRVRSPKDNPKSLIQIRTEDSITIPVTVSGREEKRLFNFNFVFPPTATQTDVFDGLKHLGNEFMNGKSVCIFSYGASGSGKTFSLFGSDTSTDRGVCTRLVEDLLRHALNDKRRSYKLSLSFLEFHKTRLTCLFSDRCCRLRDRGHVVAVEGHKSVPLTSTFTFAEQLEVALAKRQTSTMRPSGKAPWSKSLSDLAVVIKLSSKYVYFEEEMADKEKLAEEKEECVFTIVDLTGFTAQAATNQHAGGRSLAALDHVIEAIRNDVNTVPYRRHLLTHFLRPCFEGGAVCCALLTLKDSERDRKATLRTLEFGRRLMDTKLGNAPPIPGRLEPAMEAIYES